MNISKKNFYLGGVILLIVVFYFLFLSAPRNFPIGTIFRISEGSSLRSVSRQLKESQIIRSRVFFEAFVILFGQEKHVVSTNYYWENKLPVYVVARRISEGQHNLAPVTVTVPEGFNSTEIADLFAPKLSNFNKTQFLIDAKKQEGYLFPDTYFFLTTDREEEVLLSMGDNFKKKIKPLLSEITASGKSESDIITMASIIEREAKGDADREIISGILWKRIKIGMALQADAAPETYKTKGLPKNPIGNPGIEAITAAIHPQNSNYLYYLHDKVGVIHYAQTFAEHTKNISKYLR